MTTIFNDYKPGDCVQIKLEVLDMLMKKGAIETIVPGYGDAQLDSVLFSTILKNKKPNIGYIDVKYTGPTTDWGGHWWIVRDEQGEYLTSLACLPSTLFELYDEFFGMDLSLDV